jgi:hypothetical protein
MNLKINFKNEKRRMKGTRKVSKLFNLSTKKKTSRVKSFRGLIVGGKTRETEKPAIPP